MGAIGMGHQARNSKIEIKKNRKSHFCLLLKYEKHATIPMFHMSSASLLYLHGLQFSFLKMLELGAAGWLSH